MLVRFFPNDTGNPYQARLSEELCKQGAEVSFLAGGSVFLLRSKHPFRGEVFHFHWLNPGILSERRAITVLKSVVFISSVTLCRILGKRIVWTAHNIEDHESRHSRIQRLATRAMTRISHKIIAHSNQAKNVIIKEFSMKNDKKIVVIPHANYINEYQNTISCSSAREFLGINQGSFVFLFLGQLRPYKGLEELLEGFKMLNLPDVRLIVAGKPLHEDFCDEIFALVNRDPRVIFIPQFVGANEVQKLMNAADVAVFPYRKILTSGSLLLAMSFGKACIASDLPTFREHASAGGIVLVDPGNVHRLSLAMADAYRGRSTLDHIGLLNLNHVRAWGWVEMARAIYNKVYWETH